MLRLIRSGDEFFQETLLLIRSAKESLVFHTYILEADNTGTTVLEALCEAAKRGVKTEVMLDSIGSAALPAAWVARLQASGVAFRFFGKVFSSELINPGRRLHHKIMVADSKRMITGGINIAEKYHGKEGEPAWLDYAVVHEGQAAQVAAHWCHRLFGRKFQRITLFPALRHSEVRLLRNDAFRNKLQILRAYRKAIKSSVEEVIIVSPYFMPGIRMLRVMLRAARRGVKVKLLLAGKSDIPVFYTASAYLYPVMLNAGIEIYEWQASVMHAKVAVVDRKWSTIGSFNMNNLSALMSIEANLAITHDAFCRELHTELYSLLQNSKKIQAQQWMQRLSMRMKIQNFMSYYLLKTTERILRLFPIFGRKPRPEGE
jgi:cardiolipin synthase